MLSCTSDQPGWLEQTGSLLLLCTSLGAVGLGVRLRADAEQCLWVEGCALLGLDCVPWRKLQPALCWVSHGGLAWGARGAVCSCVGLLGRECAAGQVVEDLQVLCLLDDVRCWQQDLLGCICVWTYACHCELYASKFPRGYVCIHASIY